MSLLKALHDDAPDGADQHPGPELDLELELELLDETLGDGLGDTPRSGSGDEPELDIEPIDTAAVPTEPPSAARTAAVSGAAKAPPAPIPILAAAGHAGDPAPPVGSGDEQPGVSGASEPQPSTFLHTTTGVTVAVLAGVLSAVAIGGLSWVYMRDVLGDELQRRGELPPTVVDMTPAPAAVVTAGVVGGDAAAPRGGDVAQLVAGVAADAARSSATMRAADNDRVPAPALAGSTVDSAPAPSGPATGAAAALQAGTPEPARPLAVPAATGPGVGKPAPAPRTAAPATPNVAIAGPAPVRPPASPAAGVRSQPGPTAPVARIAARSVASEADTHLGVGYELYLAGDHAAAQRHYEEAVRIDPLRRDAVVGLAVIHQAQGHVSAARTYYERALDIAPGDSQAVAGLASLSASGGYQGTESDLRALLTRLPRAAHLHAALGQLYATRGQWPQAQQAWFQAVALQPDNADYSFNLAVSLERMGRPRAAIGYYQRALDMRTDTSRFDPDVASARVGELGLRW